MKTIELKETEIEVNDNENKPAKLKFSYKESLLSALNLAPTTEQGQLIGFSLEVMESRLKLIEKIEQATEKLVLDDNEYNVLNGCVAQQRFKIMHPVMVEYYKAVKDAKSE